MPFENTSLQEPVMAEQAETPSFPFTKLPIEIQLFITRHELAVAPNCKVPALLIALASDKENGKEYYEYARAQYRKINYVVSHANDTKFEAMKLKDLKLIRNLTLVFTREHLYHTYGRPYTNSVALNLGRSLAIACNRFETITLDMTREEADMFGKPLFLGSPANFVEWSIMASTIGVKSIVAVFNKSSSISAELESKFVKAMALLKLWNAKVDDEIRASAYGPNIRVLRWENESGASLRFKRG